MNCEILYWLEKGTKHCLQWCGMDCEIPYWLEKRMKLTIPRNIVYKGVEISP